jgi:hypothetical protein
VEVALSEAAREHLRELARGRCFRSPEAVIEAALWGPDGPARELSDREWDRALDRDRWNLAPSGAGRSGDETVAGIRELLAEWTRGQEAWEENETVPPLIHLSDEAFRHIDVFVRAGVYPSHTDAVEATLLSALELAPPGIDGTQIKALWDDEPQL